MPKINYVRTELVRVMPKYKKVQDCLQGEDHMRAMGDTYLPRPNPEDRSAENKARYESYLKRATFLNATGNTLEGLSGQVFSVDPAVVLPAPMAVLQEDVDGAGVTLTQQSKITLGRVLSIGRTGVLVDFPQAPVDDTGAPRAFTREELQSNLARPVLLCFDATKVINWRTRTIDTRAVLSLVVIEEEYTAEDDGFEIKTDSEWRVLYLDGANQYVAEVWRKNDNSDPSNKEPFIRVSQVMPTDYTGKRLDFIPFTFVGSINNDPNVDRVPMYDLACVNVGHWRNSADYEDSVYMVGQPTPVATGLTKDWVENVLKKKIQLGSRGMVPLPAGADLKLVSAEPNSLVKEAMDGKERQMVALGAQLVEQKEVQRTLGEAKMERAVTTSVLVQCAKNVSSAYTQALHWARLFYGDVGDASFTLSTDFAIVRMSPEDRSALIADYQGGLLSWTEARTHLRTSGLAVQDDAAAKTEIDQEAEQRMNMDAAAAAALADATGGGNGDQNAE